MIQELLLFENAIQGALLKDQYCCFFDGAPTISKKKRVLHIEFGEVMTNQNQQTKIRTLYMFKMIQKTCSTKEVVLMGLPQGI